MKTIQLTAQTQKDLLTSLLKRSPGNYTKYEFTVAEIIDKVKEEGDSALFSYTKKFDKWEMNADNIRVTEAEIEEAFADAEEEFIEVMKRAAANITDFHKKQLRNSWIDTKPEGSILGQRIIPVDISGVYVPDGKAAYPSSLLMNVLPAKYPSDPGTYGLSGASCGG